MWTGKHAAALFIYVFYIVTLNNRKNHWQYSRKQINVGLTVLTRLKWAQKQMCIMCRSAVAKEVAQGV